MISQTAEYALRATASLAMEPEVRLTTFQIAERTQVPFCYLSKVLQALGRGGLVHSHRGLGGGFELTRPPGEITVLDVINAVDPTLLELAPRFEAGNGSGDFCPLHRKLLEVQRAVQQSFAETTLAGLVDDR